MNQGANVSSVEAIDGFRAEMIECMTKVLRALDDVSDRAKRTKLWLENDRLPFWQQEIRKRAQDEIRSRTDLSPEQKAAALAQVKSAAKGDQSTSKVKFEATAEELARSKKNVAMAGDTTPDAGKIRVKSREVEKQGPTKEEGIARLRKAKERAREELEEE